MTSACPSCGKKYTFPADAVGREFVCKQCDRPLLIQPGGLQVVEKPSPQRAKPERPIRADIGSDDGIPVRRRVAEPAKFSLVDYLLFRRLLAAGVIVPIYWLVTALCMVSGGLTIYFSFSVPVISLGAGLAELMAGRDTEGSTRSGVSVPSAAIGFSLPLFVLGVAQIVIVPLILRLACEFVLSIILIYNRLGDIKDALDRQATRPLSDEG